MQSSEIRDPVKVASHNYRVLLENSRVRVLEYRSKSGDRTPVHSHTDCLVYSYCPATIRINVPYGESAEYEFQTGELLWAEASTHNTENIGWSASGWAAFPQPWRHARTARLKLCVKDGATC